MTEDDEFDKAFEGFGEDKPVVAAADPAKEGEDKTVVTPPVPPVPPVAPPVVALPKTEEPKEDDAIPPVDPKKEEVTPPAGDAPKKEEGAETPENPETPPAKEEPKPLTLDDVKSVINEVRTEERTSGQALEAATKEVLDAYYPDGLSNVLIDQNSGKELKTPQDVVDASGGQMPIEEAAQWLINEQFKVDQNIAKIRSDAQAIADTTLKFKQDGIEVLKRYEPVFKAYPQLQQKVWNQYKKLVKSDDEKGVILSAPDMREFYDTLLEPYRLAVEYQTGQPGITPTPPVAPAEVVTPPATPGADDRLDEGGDGGATPPDDPNDFAQQVVKELSKPL